MKHVDSEAKWVSEICNDAQTHEHRLTDWEREFIESMRERVQICTDLEMNFSVTEKQTEVLKRIEAKLYRSG